MRLSSFSRSKIPWYLKPFFWHQQRKYGQALEPAKVWAQSPRLFLSLVNMVGFLDRKRSPLPVEVRALVSMRVSQINGCTFCMDLHSLMLLKRLNDEEKVAELTEWRTSARFSAAEIAALEYAEQMTNSHQQVTDACFQQLSQAYQEAAIIELTALIALQNLSSKFNNALGVEPQGLCRKS